MKKQGLAWHKLFLRLQIPNIYSNIKHLGTYKTSFDGGLPVAEQDLVWAAICLDRLGCQRDTGFSLYAGTQPRSRSLTRFTTVQNMPLLFLMVYEWVNMHF